MFLHKLQWPDACHLHRAIVFLSSWLLMHFLLVIIKGEARSVTVQP